MKYHLPLRPSTDHHYRQWDSFESKEIKEFCQKYGIEKRFAAVSHPKANGQVEAVNKIIKSILKKRLEKAIDKWVYELPTALWAYRTTHKTMIGHSPFTLAYGTEAIIPVELEVPSHRVTYYDPESNQNLLLESLDFIDEKHEGGNLRAAAYRHRALNIITKRSDQEFLVWETLF